MPLISMEEPKKSLLFCDEVIDVDPQKILQGSVFVPIEQLTPNKILFSFECAKMVFKDIGRCTYDNGRSFLSLSQALPVILGPDDKIIVLAGHHRIKASLYGQAETVPVHVVADYSGLNTEQFIDTLLDNELMYPYDFYGNRLQLEEMSWDRMENDSNIYFITLCCLPSQYNPSPINSSYLLGILQGNGYNVSVAKLKMARLLREQGFTYEEKIWENSPGPKIISSAAYSLKKRKDQSIPGVKVYRKTYKRKRLNT